MKKKSKKKPMTKKQKRILKKNILRLVIFEIIFSFVFLMALTTTRPITDKNSELITGTLEDCYMRKSYGRFPSPVIKFVVDGKPYISSVRGIYKATGRYMDDVVSDMQGYIGTDISILIHKSDIPSFRKTRYATSFWNDDTVFYSTQLYNKSEKSERICVYVAASIAFLLGTGWNTLRIIARLE